MHPLCLVLFSLLFSVSSLILGSPLPPVPSECRRWQQCNGEMCADTCVIGSVVIDAWASSALDFQRSLQVNRSLLFLEAAATHNSAIVQDYGMGIEEMFLKKLLTPIHPTSNEVVIANQRHSIYDQLRMGVRHVELDVYYFPFLNFRICHWPVCPPDFFLFVNDAAIRQDKFPLNWNPSNLGCDGNKPHYEDILKEIRNWLEETENRNEFIFIYLDNKNIETRLIEQFANVTLPIIGDLLFTPLQLKNEYNGQWPTVFELISKNRRILFENGREDWAGDPLADQYFFTPPIWVQFGPDKFEKFPNCSVNGVPYYGKKHTRSLDGSLTLGPAFLWEGRVDYPIQTIIDMAECSINMQSMDQITPYTMENFIWSWERNQPNLEYRCTMMTPEGRWRTESCSIELPHACVSQTHEFDWIVTDSVGAFGTVSCPVGYVFSKPPTGIINTILSEILDRRSVWLNHQVDELQSLVWEL